MARNDHRLERITENGFDLTVIGARKPHLWESLMRDQPIQVGDVVRVRDMRVEVMAVAAGVATRLRVSFERPLAELCLLHWRDGLLRVVDTPEPGATVALPSSGSNR